MAFDPGALESVNGLLTLSVEVPEHLKETSVAIAEVDRAVADAIDSVNERAGRINEKLGGIEERLEAEKAATEAFLEAIEKQIEEYATFVSEVEEKVAESTAALNEAIARAEKANGTMTSEIETTTSHLQEEDQESHRFFEERHTEVQTAETEFGTEFQVLMDRLEALKEKLGEELDQTRTAIGTYAENLETERSEVEAEVRAQGSQLVESGETMGEALNALASEDLAEGMGKVLDFAENEVEDVLKRQLTSFIDAFTEVGGDLIETIFDSNGASSDKREDQTDLFDDLGGIWDVVKGLVGSLDDLGNLF